MDKLKTTIGLEIHVQLKTKSKMFCRCDNDAQNKKPNTTVCPVCLGMPGALPVANKEAVLWTIKTGLALDCAINKIAKFDRKHYFYPDLPKGYQISQYDEPFCVGGCVKLKVKDEKSEVVEERVIRLNRIHLEEDAGKLVHKNGKSLVDLNRAGTPLMEIVTEPDIASPKEAGDFLRKLQKIVRDVANVSEASMEKGHLRCDANISVCDDKGQMSKIVELKNLNSFKFVEKALAIEEEKLKASYGSWPEKRTKSTHGYDSVRNITYVQRVKEEASDYRYFPEPDLPPFDTTKFDLDSLRQELGENEEERVNKLVEEGIALAEAKILVENSTKLELYKEISKHSKEKGMVAKTIIHNYFGFDLSSDDLAFSGDYAKTIDALTERKIQKNNFAVIVAEIHKGKKFEEVFSRFSGETEKINLDEICEKIIAANPNEVTAYKNGKKQLLGFFMGQMMRETGGKVDPAEASKIIQQNLEKK